MKKNFAIRLSVILCTAMLFTFILGSCAPAQTGGNHSGAGNGSKASQTEAPTEPPTEDPIQKQLKTMTTDEKIGQLVTAGFDGTEVDETFADIITNGHVGGAILFSPNITDGEQLVSLTNEIKKTAGDAIPLMIGMDEEGGDVTRLPDEVLSMPSALTVAASQSTDVCYSAGKNIASQLKAFGLSTGYSPDLDIWSNPNNTVIGDRAFGTDAQSVAKYGIAALSGMRDGGAIPVVKHFPGHGDTDADSHYSLPVVTKTKAQLFDEELIPFAKAIEQKAPAVMVSHIQCTEIDSDYPASLSKNVVQGLLRDEMGFDGAVFTDDLTMGAIVENYSLEKACVLAVNAGCDMLLVCHGYENVNNVLASLKAAVASGEITAKRLDEAVTRILKLKADYNVTSAAVTLPDIEAMNAATQKFFN